MSLTMLVMSRFILFVLKQVTPPMKTILYGLILFMSTIQEPCLRIGYGNYSFCGVFTASTFILLKLKLILTKLCLQLD